MNMKQLAIAMLVLSCISTVICMVANLNVRIKKFKIHLYWIIPFFCAVALLASKATDFNAFASRLADMSAKNISPLKILIIFISMSGLSIFLDQTGFFRLLASKALKRHGMTQKQMFFILYFLVAFLTVLTSNATVILTLTPFICYFARNADIDPRPFLFLEFVSANTWSMFSLVGNITNNYIARSFGVEFVPYLAVMTLPTIFAAATSLSILYLLFRKKLTKPMTFTPMMVKVQNLPALVIGIIGISVCTFLLIISQYAHIPMWAVTLASFLFVLVAGTICFLAEHQNMKKIRKTLRRMPWHLIPFLLSMFVIILALEKAQITHSLSGIVDNKHTIFSSGFLSVIFSNLLNNIAMSLFFTNIMQVAQIHNKEILFFTVFATVIGSNIGSLLTPVSAMNAVMWRSTIRHKHFKLSFFDFIKVGVIVTIPTLLAALLGLYLVSFGFANNGFIPPLAPQ